MDITVSANAKINLYLDITGKRPDGYHNIKTLMHTVDLRDSVKIMLTSKPGIKIICDKPFLPTDERNIAYRAAKEFFSAINEKAGVIIKIKKCIPVGGGLGGSSTDGAAVLWGLNYLFGKPYSESELLVKASSLGADVPFCLKKGAALCEGIGDVMTFLPPLQSAFAVILKPDFSLNTKEMYSLYDLSEKDLPPDFSKIQAALCEKNIPALGKTLYNAFLPPALSLKPQIAYHLDRILKSGALGASMSGSGSCLFGLYESKKDADKAAESLNLKNTAAYSVRLI